MTPNKSRHWRKGEAINKESQPFFEKRAVRFESCYVSAAHPYYNCFVSIRLHEDISV